MQPLFPKIKPYAKHEISVDTPHKIYVEECGEPDGLPILFVHGGPGMGCMEDSRRFFDPQQYRIILFDQRGCGRSTPHAELKNNTTQYLISDMEVIREHLQIERWILFGGSWGSTLSLLYAQEHPDKVLHLILRGIFLGRQQDIDWFYQQGASEFFPDFWQDFLQPIARDEHCDLVSAYYKRLTQTNELTRMAAAKAWALWEGRCLSLNPNQRAIDLLKDPSIATGIATIECHYFINHCFIAENQILNHINKLKRIPAVIIHGRYDMICRLQAAWLLQKHWREAELNIVRHAGHASSEPAITDALIHATQTVAKLHRV